MRSIGVASFHLSRRHHDAIGHGATRTAALANATSNLERNRKRLRTMLDQAITSRYELQHAVQRLQQNHHDIDRDRIDAIALAKRREPRVVRTKRGIVVTDKTVSAGTVRRVIGVLKAVLNAAVEWEWLDRAPVTKLAKTVQKRIRWLTPAQAERLLAELPEHLSDMARFSLETGLRRSNVTGLQWSQVDIVRRIAWIQPDQAKAKKAITVPLSETAIAILLRQRAKKRAPEFVDSVFVYKGRRCIRP